MTTAPYGSWPSAITAESLAAAALGLGETQFDPGTGDLYWLQARPGENGRVSLWRRRTDGSEQELTPAPANVRSRVHEYGGGAFAVAGGRVIFSDHADNRLFLIEPDSSIRPLTTDSRLRYAALRLYPEHDLIIAVREDHRDVTRPVTGSRSEPVNTVVARRISDHPAEEDHVLCRGADFYAGPELAPDGRLAWIEWSHPNMPWDSTRLMISPLPTVDGRVDLTAVRRPLSGAPVAGGVAADPDTAESVTAPGWLPDGSLIFVSDRSDWWNLYRFDGTAISALHPVEAEFTPPPWSLGSRPYAIIDDRRIGCWWNVGNRHRIGVLHLDTGELAAIDTDAVGAGSLTAAGELIATRLDFADRPSELTMIDISSRTRAVVRRSAPAAPAAGSVSIATEVSWDSDLGRVYGWFYPPTHPDHTGPPDERAPMITVSHGGPTGASSPGLDPGVQFWTSRGIAVLDVNYSGSTGYGRRYRQRLRRGWGVVDVADCVNGALALADQGRVDRSRLAISGSSAGGYTTLRALTEYDVFSAGISRYGIGDLTALVADTHKFESRYPESLIGSYPAEQQLYADRSPINHVHRISAPILLLQGSEDAVVPPNQAETFADAARAKELPVALIMYSGEGHGFRRGENIVSSQQAALAFLGRVFGFVPADELPPIMIENAPD